MVAKKKPFSADDLIFSIVASVLISVITGFVSATTTIAVIKTDIEWIKKDNQELHNADTRLTDKLDKLTMVRNSR